MLAILSNSPRHLRMWETQPLPGLEHQIGVGLDRMQIEDTVQWQLHDRMLTGSLQQVFKSHHEHGPSWQLA
jgi:hypothetical protein